MGHIMVNIIRPLVLFILRKLAFLFPNRAKSYIQTRLDHWPRCQVLASLALVQVTAGLAWLCTPCDILPLPPGRIQDRQRTCLVLFLSRASRFLFAPLAFSVGRLHETRAMSVQCKEIAKNAKCKEFPHIPFLFPLGKSQQYAGESSPARLVSEAEAESLTTGHRFSLLPLTTFLCCIWNIVLYFFNKNTILEALMFSCQRRCWGVCDVSV